VSDKFTEILHAPVLRVKDTCVYRFRLVVIHGILRLPSALAGPPKSSPD